MHGSLSITGPLICKIREEGLDMDVGTVQSPAVNVTMPGQRQGRRFPQQKSSRWRRWAPASALTVVAAEHPSPPLPPAVFTGFELR